MWTAIEHITAAVTTSLDQVAILTQASADQIRNALLWNSDHIKQHWFFKINSCLPRTLLLTQTIRDISWIDVRKSFLIIDFYTITDPKSPYYNNPTGHFALQLCIDGVMYMVNFIWQTYHIYEGAYHNHEQDRGISIEQHWLQHIPLSIAASDKSIVDILRAYNTQYAELYSLLITQRAQSLSEISEDVVERISDITISYTKP